MRYKNEAFFRQKIERLLMRASKAQSADALLADMKIKKADRPGVLLALQKMEVEGRIRRCWTAWTDCFSFQRVCFCPDGGWGRGLLYSRPVSSGRSAW